MPAAKSGGHHEEAVVEGTDERLDLHAEREDRERAPAGIGQRAGGARGARRAAPGRGGCRRSPPRRCASRGSSLALSSATLIQAVPMEPPSSRVRLKRPVALPRFSGARSERAMTESGMKMKPMAKARTICGRARSQKLGLAGEVPVHPQAEARGGDAEGDQHPPVRLAARTCRGAA